MRIPSVEESEGFLAEAEIANPGPWVQHSKNVALAARLIAERISGLDPEVSYVLGLLNDIGRREGRTDIRHLIDGYRFLNDLEYEDAARISITHGFPIADLEAYMGERDCSPEDLQFLEEFISSVELNKYDRLIQLCDAMAPASGFCLMEKRMVDVALRYGINEATLSGWEARFQILAEFEHEIGQPVYSLLPGIIEGTFGERLSGIDEAA
jgi:hypothetical protein